MIQSAAVPNTTIPPRAIGLALGTLTVFCWAAYNVAAIHGLEVGLRPVDLTLLRFGTAGLILAPVLVFLRFRESGGPGWPSFGQALVLSLLGGPVFGLLAVGGYAFAPLSHGMVFGPAAVFVTGTALAAVFTGEAIRLRHLAAGAVILAGLVVLSGIATGEARLGVWRGAVFFIVAGVLWAAFTMLMRLWSIDPLRGTVMVGTVSGLIAPVIFALALAMGMTSGLGSAPAAEVALQAVMQGLIGGVLSVAALIGAVRFLGAAGASLLPCFAPIVALGLAVPALGDWPTETEIAGVLIAIVGLGLARCGEGRSRVSVT